MSSMAEGPRPMRSSYAGTASIISTGTTQTARQNNPTSTTNSVVSGDNRSMGWVPPHLRGRRDASQQPGSLATASTQRPQLRGMAGPNLGTAIPPHLRGIQPSTASTDSRAGIQSFASSTVGSTTGTDALQPSNVHEYNAFSPHGQVYRETTGGIPANGTGTFMSGRKEIKVSRHGWQRGVRYLNIYPFRGSRTDMFDRIIESALMSPPCLHPLPKNRSRNLITVQVARMRCDSLLVPELPTFVSVEMMHIGSVLGG